MNESVISTFTGVKFIQGLTPMTQENWQSYFGSAIKNGVYSGLAPKSTSLSPMIIRVSDGVVFANGIQARLETESGYTDCGSLYNTGLEDRLICVRVHYNSETAELIQKSNVTDIPSSAVERTKNYLFTQTLVKLIADESYLCTRNESYWDIPIFYQSKPDSVVSYGRDLRRKVELSPSKLTNPPLDTTDRTWQYGVLISGQNRYTAGDSSQNIIYFPDVVNVADGAIITISAPSGSDFDFILSQVPYTGSWIYTDNPNGTTPGYNQGIRTIYTYSNGSGVWTENVVITGSGTDNVILGTKRTIPANTSKSFRINFGGITVGDNGYINPQFTIEEFDNVATVNWGRIGGSITAQTDLGDALALKANASDVNDSISDVNDALVLKANASDVYNKTETYSKTEVDNALALKTNVTDVYNKTETYTKTEVDDALAVKSDSSDVYDKTETYSKAETYNKTEVDNKIADAAGSLDVYSKSEVDNKLSVKANTADVYNKTETYTKTEVDNKISNSVNPVDVIYVDKAEGNDSTGDGTSSKPYKTLQNAINKTKNYLNVKIILNGGLEYDDSYKVEITTFRAVTLQSSDSSTVTINGLYIKNAIVRLIGNFKITSPTVIPNTEQTTSLYVEGGSLIHETLMYRDETLTIEHQGPGNAVEVTGGGKFIMRPKELNSLYPSLINFNLSSSQSLMHRCILCQGSIVSLGEINIMAPGCYFLLNLGGFVSYKKITEGSYYDSSSAASNMQSWGGLTRNGI